MRDYDLVPTVVSYSSAISALQPLKSRFYANPRIPAEPRASVLEADILSRQFFHCELWGRLAPGEYKRIASDHSGLLRTARPEPRGFIVVAVKVVLCFVWP